MRTGRYLQCDRRAFVDWSAVDWSRQDVEIASAVGRSRERVRQARIEMGKARPRRYRRRTAVTAAERIAWMETARGTIPEVARIAGCGEEHAYSLLRGMGKGFRRRPRGCSKYDWSRIPPDWVGRTDKELAGLVGVKDPSVVAQWRIRHGMRKRGG